MVYVYIIRRLLQQMYCSAALNRTRDIINQIFLSNSNSIYLRKSINRPRVPATMHTYDFDAKQITCRRVCTVDRVKCVMTYGDPNRDDNNDNYVLCDSDDFPMAATYKRMVTHRTRVLLQKPQFSQFIKHKLRSPLTVITVNNVNRVLYIVFE